MTYLCREAKDLTPQEWLRFHEFWQQMNRESLPHREIDDFTAFQKSWTHFPQPVVITCLVILRDGVIVGCARYWHEAAHSPHYLSNQNVFNSDLHLLESQVDETLITFLFERLRAAYLKLGLRTWQLVVFQERITARILAQLKFRQVNLLKEYVLELDKVDWNLIKSWAQGKTGFTLQKLDLHTPTTLQAVAALGAAAQADIPIQESVATIRTYDVAYYKQRMQTAQDKGMQYQAFGVYKGDELVALTLLLGRIINPKLFDVELTGVARAFRGQSLAKMVKAHSLLELHRTFPSFRYMLTGTNTENAPMQSLNLRMGFEARGGFAMLHSIEQPT